MLLSFVFKNNLQQHCLLRSTIIGCHVRSDLSMLSARANDIVISSFFPTISLFCPLFHFSARYFNKNSKATSQSDLGNNE